MEAVHEHPYVFFLQLLRSEFLRILEMWRILPEMLQEKADDITYSYIFSINISLKMSLISIYR